MPRPKKNQPAVDLDSSLESDQPSNEVEIEIESQAENDDLLTSASRLVGGISLTNQKRPNKLENDRKYRERKKTRGGVSAEDFSTIIITLLTLALSAWSAPNDLKPNEDEINAFSVPATRMLLRHVPIAAKMSQDALDALGMIAALSAYSVRTRPAWSKYNEERKSKQALETETQSAAMVVTDDPMRYHPRPGDLMPESAIT